MKININLIFETYLESLKKNKEKIAYLQLIGRIEDFLVKLFCYNVYTSTNGKNFAVVNMGNRKEKEQVIDICILSGNNLDDPEIIGLIEAKYFRNWHRFRPYNAKDEIRTLMKTFNNQIHSINTESHGWFRMNPNVHSIIGLAIISYVNFEKEPSDKLKFYGKVLQVANEELKNVRHSNLTFKNVFEDAEVKLLDKVLYVSLEIGLWF